MESGYRVRRRRGSAPAFLIALWLLASLALVVAAADTASRPTRIAYAAPPAPPGEAAESDSGCGRTAPSGSVTISPTVNGVVRVVRVHVPTGYTGVRALPLLLNLHGSGSTAARQETLTELDATADEHTFLVAYPQGDRHSGTGFVWNVPATPSFSSRGPDDVAFIGDVVALLRHRYCVDNSRVYASGFSGGARMVSQLACTPPVRLAGVVAAGGLRAPSPCHPGWPVAVLAFHGTADASNPYNGHGQPYWTYSVPAAAQRWARYDGCPGTPTVSRPYPEVTVTSYQGCRNGSAVQLYTLTGKGHRWPLATEQFVPDEILWRFLSDDRQAPPKAAAASLPPPVAPPVAAPQAVAPPSTRPEAMAAPTATAQPGEAQPLRGPAV